MQALKVSIYVTDPKGGGFPKTTIGSHLNQQMLTTRTNTIRPVKTIGPISTMLSEMR